MRCVSRRVRSGIGGSLAVLLGLTLAIAPSTPVSAEPLSAGRVLRVHVPDAVGGKTVIGQLTVANAGRAGHVTAFACADGIPTGPDGRVSRSDLNYFGDVAPIWSNRLIVEADDDGDICFHALTTVDLVVDINAVSFDTGITSFGNRRVDTRTGSPRSPAAGGTLRINVPEAEGGATVVGQLTVANAAEPGHVTAYPCDQGLPTGRGGRTNRSDLNYFGGVAPIWSNRLIVEADDDGDICLTPLTDVDLVVDVNGAADNGIRSFPNRRVDTRTGSVDRPSAGETLRINVPRAVGGKTVIGQLTVARADRPGHVTAYPCDQGIPTDDRGAVARSDLNYFGNLAPIWSNRLIVEADDDGDICFTPLTEVDLVVDINGVAERDAIFSFPNVRTDTRTGDGTIEWLQQPTVDGIPIWPPYTPLPRLDGVAALTGRTASRAVTARPIVAVKVDNYRRARPHWGLEHADAVFEVEHEGISRFVALFHSDIPASLGPVRSARTGDLDLLAAMNRPVFGYSGSNPGVGLWLDSAAASGVLVDFSAITNGCYARRSDRPGPHNLGFDPMCAIERSPSAGPARPLWTTDGDWAPPGGLASRADSTFTVPMVGVRVEWTWDADEGVYLRSQDGRPHVVDNGEADGDERAQLAANTVVEVMTTYVPSVVDERSPHAMTTGSGAAVVHRSGRAYRATWSRPTPYEPYVFTADIDGDEVEIPVDVGTTWIELVRAG